MITMRNFYKYTPQNHPLAGFALFLMSEDGQDWYEAQANFAPDTWKIEYEENGTIVAAGKDVSAMAPLGHSVSEVESLPEGFSVNGYWRYDNGSIVKDVDKITQNELAGRASEADKVITVLSSERDAEIISDDDLARWKAWVAYRKELRELDVTATDIKWPAKPE